MKKACYRYIYTIIFVLFTTVGMMGQNASFSRIESLISQGEYSAALDELSSISTADMHSVDYYRIMCQMKLSPAKACEELDAFLVNYPTSTHRTQLISSMADAMWDRSEYGTALKYYSMLDRFTYADETQRSRHNYRLAYCQYATGNYDAARRGMYTLIDDTTYGVDATYIYAHICYDDGDLALAAEYFEKIKDSAPYNKKSNAYLCGIYLNTRNWGKSIEAGEAFLSSTASDSTDVHTVKKNLATAYFNNGEYDKCLSILQEELKASTPSDDNMLDIPCFDHNI